MTWTSLIYTLQCFPRKLNINNARFRDQINKLMSLSFLSPAFKKIQLLKIENLKTAIILFHQEYNMNK